MSSNRRLYDACRRYKYFDRKYRMIKDVNSKIHDEYVRKALYYCENDLKDAFKELCFAVFDELNVVEDCNGVVVHNDVEHYMSLLGDVAGSRIRGKDIKLRMSGSSDFARMFLKYINEKNVKFLE